MVNTIIPLVIVSFGIIGIIHWGHLQSRDGLLVSVFATESFLGLSRARLRAKIRPHSRTMALSSTLTLPLVLLLVLGITLAQINLASAAGTLSVEIIAGYNLVVDSNVESPSTYAPAAATVGARFCNNTGSTLNDVQGFIGDYKGIPSASTPGIYPARDSTLAGFIVEHPHLANTGDYAFTHIGGRAGLADASRYIGMLEPGECRVQYWHFKYPRVSNDGAGNPQEPPNGVGVWGLTRDPDDDLWLTFDVWVTSAEGSNSNASWKMTMRNEISAMANKIEPHNGRWFNTNTSTVFPGDLITSNGVLYNLGNINKGFDNDGDGDYDYNAWLQPIGDPSFDPSCFRLIRTSGIFTVTRSSGQPDLVLHFADQLYFTDLPPDNTGAIGNVYYTFLALDGPCNAALTPYQEAASGADNEKFNADFGAGIPPAESHAPEVEIDKLGNAVVSLGDVISYEVPAKNEGTVDAGLPLTSGGGGGGDLPWVPLVISDAIPSGLVYVPGSATHTFTSTGVIVLFSTDDGATWTETEPPAAQITHIQWWLTDTLRAGHSGSVTFEATVPVTYSGSYVQNCAEGSFGAGATFDQACTITLISGTNKIGDLVWRDDNGDSSKDGGEPGLPNITVNLYLDRDGDGVIDNDDLLVITATTSITGFYVFDSLPNGDFLVQVDRNDPDLPFGYSPSTKVLYDVTLSGANYWDADFGFGPSLSLNKTLLTSPALEDNDVVYTIDVSNLRPGNGSGQLGACTYTAWAGNVNLDTDTPASGSGNRAWQNTSNALGVPDGSYAMSVMGNNPDQIALSGFNMNPRAGNIISVEVVIHAREEVELKDGDMLQLTVYNTDAATAPVYDFTGLSHFTGSAGDTYIFRQDVTGNKGGGWTWADFSSDATEILFLANKEGGTPGDIGLDAVAIVVTTDQSCGQPSDTLNPVSLTDVYDADLLEFVSADPPQAAVSTGGGSPYANTGVITWTNVGPIYAGGTKVVTVTFRGLEPPDSFAYDSNLDGESDPATITNTATVTGVKFVTGELANGDQDDAVTVITPTGTIGDFVWNDIDGDGVYEPNGADATPNTADDERSIADVTVELQDGVCTPSSDCPTTVTDENGAYLFEGPVDGSYTVVVDTTTLPNGGAGSANSHDLDSDNDSDSGAITINNSDGNTSNDDELDADFGYTMPTMIEGSIWNDWNRSGTSTPDAGEEGLSGITVYADDGVCTYPGTCQTGTTDANGDFTITGLAPGTYTVTVDLTTLPTGTWTQSYDHPNGPDGVPGSGDDVIALDDAVPVTIVAGGVGDADFSYYETASSDIGDTVYTDWSGDGDQDTGEEGINGVTVRLYRDANSNGIVEPATDAAVLTATTTITGYYLFANLPADDFIVVVDENDLPFPAGGYQQTADPDATLDSKAAVTTNGTTDVLSVDFGYQPIGSSAIGDFVWKDNNRDGYQGATEPGLPDILVTLYEDGNGNDVYDPLLDAVVMTVTTDADGKYLFEYLPAGDYLVSVDTADTDLPTDGYGNLYVLSSGSNPITVTLGVVENYLDADFGFATGAVVGDFVWRDDDLDGFLDLDEPGIDNVTVTLHQWTDVDTDGVYSSSVDIIGPAIMTATTSLTLTYLFTGLPEGDYAIVVDMADPDLPTTNLTYDPDPDFDAAVGVDLSPGQIYYGADFGVGGSDTIGDLLWIDLNDNGVYDPGETGLANVTVSLYDSTNTLVLTDTTDNDGYYLFTGILPDTYTVTVQTSDLPAGLMPSYDPDGTLDNQSGNIVLNAGDTILTIDFGYVPNLNITKTSVGENAPLVASDTVTYTLVISNPSPPLATVYGTTISDTIPANTNYVSGSLAITPTTAGDVSGQPVGNLIYIHPITINGNSSVTVTFQVTVTDPVPAGVTAITNTVLLTSTMDITATDTVTNAVARPANITGQVRDDVDADGVLGDAESGVPDVTIQLWSDPNGDGDPSDGTAIITTTTNASGYYTFTNLLPGDYVVVETDPSGYTSTNDKDGTGNNSANQIGVSLPGNVDSTGNDFLDTSEDPAIGLAKSVGTVINNGDGTYDVPYTLVAENLGNVALNNVQITDDLSVTFAGAVGFSVIAGPSAAAPLNANSGYDGASDVNLLAGTDTLAVGEIATITFTVLVTPGANLGPYTNTATIEGTSPGGTTVTDVSDDGVDPDPDGDGDPGEPGESDPTPVSFPGNPDLEIAQTLLTGDPVLVGEGVQFQIVVTNTGNTVLSTVPLTDTYDTAYLSYVGATPISDDNTDDGQINWTDVGSIPVGSSKTITVNFTATAATPSTTNNASASATDDNGVPVPEDSDSDTVAINEPGLEVRKLVQIARAAPTQVVTYTLIATNTGGVALNSVTITDTLPVGFAYVPGSASPFAPTVNGQTLVWPNATAGADLLPGQNVQISFEATVPTTIGTYINTGLAEGTYPGGVVTDTGEVPITVTDPAVEVRKGVAPPGAVNGIVTFTVVITNVGPSTLDVVPLFDHFVGPVEYIGGTPPADDIDNVNGVLAWNDLTGPAPHGFGRDLAPGEVFVLNTVFRITVSSENFTMTNTAAVTNATDVLGNDANDDDDSATIINEPTAVELLYLRATGQQGGVLVEWATLLEMDSYGFWLYRATLDQFAQAERMAFQPSQGSDSGTEYAYLDKEVEPGQRYWYWLVEVDNQGVETPYGPISAMADALDALGHRVYLPLIMMGR